MRQVPQKKGSTSKVGLNILLIFLLIAAIYASTLTTAGFLGGLCVFLGCLLAMGGFSRVLAGALKKHRPSIGGFLTGFVGIWLVWHWLIFPWITTSEFNQHLNEYTSAMSAAPPSVQVGENARIRGKVIVLELASMHIDPMSFELPDSVRAYRPDQVGTVAGLKFCSKSHRKVTARPWESQYLAR